jgi:excisionase family DNA binding protein
MQSPYLTLKEAAEYCRVHPVTVQRWALSGQLNVGHAGKALRFRVEDLDRFMFPRAYRKQGRP